MALLSFAGQGYGVRAEDNPMQGQGEAYIADPQAAEAVVDDEPALPSPGMEETMPTPGKAVAPMSGVFLPGVSLPQVKAPVEASPGEAGSSSGVSLPLPPRRPFSDRVMQPPSEVNPPGAKAPGEGAGATRSAEDLPAGNPPSGNLPAAGQSVSREELEAEEAGGPEPPQVEKQTEAVNIACLKPGLLDIIQRTGRHFGSAPLITSGQRLRGRRGSYHRRCMAADFIIPGIERARIARYLRSLPDAGGVGTYCHTKAVHIDIGEPRNWYQCGFRFRFAQR